MIAARCGNGDGDVTCDNLRRRAAAVWHTGAEDGNLRDVHAGTRLLLL